MGRSDEKMEALGEMRYEIGVEQSKGRNIMFAKPEIERNVQNDKVTMSNKGSFMVTIIVL